MFAKRLANNVSLVTAYRYYPKRPDTGVGSLMNKVCRVVGLIPSKTSHDGRPKYDPDLHEVRAVYTGIHASISMLTILPVPFLYASQSFSAFYLCAIVGYCIWNGGAYYSQAILRSKQLTNNNKQETKSFQM